jgi:hypothetical protein
VAAEEDNNKSFFSLTLLRYAAVHS